MPPDGRHYAEPEILPPDRHDERETGRAAWTGVFVDTRGIRRIHVAKIGPLGLFSFSLIAGIVSVALLTFVLGVFVLLIPVVGLLIVAALIMSLLRAFARRSE